MSNNINYFKHTSLFFGHVTLQGRHDLWVVLLLKMITGQCFFPFYGYYHPLSLRKKKDMVEEPYHILSNYIGLNLVM